MRIIDKNHDFYDYLQDPTDNTLVFDRRNSFLLEKKHVLDAMDNINYRDNTYKHLILQCGAMFWVFQLTATEFIDNTVGIKRKIPANYDIELLTNFKNYDKPNVLIDIKVTYDPFHDVSWDYKTRKYTLYERKFDPEDIKDMINSSDRYYYERGTSLSTLKTSKYSNKNGTEYKTYTIPILRACGVADFINPIDIFCAIEEHFSREKTAAERTEPIGATNNDKIIMHGFDTKTSFRGKNS